MFKYLRYAFLLGPRLLFDWVFYLVRYGRHPERYPLAVRYARVRSLVLKVLGAMRLDIRQRGYAGYLGRKGSRLYVCNHLSDLDPLVLIALSPEPISFVAKKETEKYPVIGSALRAIDGFFMDRSDLMQSAKVLREVAKRLREGKGPSYCIFPEGTRNRDPEKDLLEFHPGSYKASAWSGMPYEEVALYGTFRVLHTRPDDRRQPVFITYLGLHRPDADTVKESVESRGRINAEVKDLRELDRAYYAQGRQRKSLRGLPRPYIHS